MIALPTSDRSRIAAALALAEANANPVDGERLAAIGAVERLLSRHGLRLRDLVSGDTAAQTRTAARTWRDVAADCRARSGSLRRWEREFIHGLGRFPRLSPKQHAILREIADRVGVMR